MYPAPSTINRNIFYLDTTRSSCRMSSNNGSDIASDTIDAIESASQAPASSLPRRSPLKELSTNHIPSPAQLHPSDQCGRSSMPAISETPKKHLHIYQQPTHATQPRTSEPSVALDQPYRLTFGKYQGQLLDDVPGSYIGFLKKKGIPRNIPALKAAIDAWDQRRELVKREAISSQKSLEPSSSLGPIASQHVRHSQPPSTPLRTRLRSRSSSPAFESDDRPAAKRARHSKGLLPFNASPSSSLPPPSSAPVGSSYQHSALTTPLNDVARAAPRQAVLPRRAILPRRASLCRPAHNLQITNIDSTLESIYIIYLRKQGAFERNKVLAAAVAEFEQKYPPGSRYTFTFGKYVGLGLKDVPDHYIQYLRDTNAAAEHEDLREALYYFATRPRTTSELRAEKAASRKQKKLGGVRTGSSFTGGNRFEFYNFTENGESILITPTQALEYFHLQQSDIHEARVQTSNRYAKLYDLRGVYRIAKEMNSCVGETPMQAMRRFKSDCHNH
ncbi:hypothetical protein NA57DRAFT_56993 [Rhizodiscina lignyota]|uniref:Uncharacterized protein n=1 Tax=Rhizodiscina lignyota TaxID=1504668 RepID=A0A9P4M4K1_9PEZI|nr:hypothetical protein NA57DRAFT_56993 [Rhizodiscina lignyota]